ncbi:hypothetical protein [Actinomadura nitritigenes]|uniref:hypothetical protein n=1 Tax=Actinomadura nitritigenes TaxID=134602 RepID=UPI003D8FE794
MRALIDGAGSELPDHQRAAQTVSASGSRRARRLQLDIHPRPRLQQHRAAISRPWSTLVVIAHVLFAVVTTTGAPANPADRVEEE